MRSPSRNRRRGLALTGLLAFAGLVQLGAPEVRATEPLPALVLQTSGGTVRDNSVITTGTAVTVSVGGLLVQGTGSRELRIDLPAGVVYQTGGVTAPEGWTVEYSTNSGGSWSGTQPTPASSVNSVRATSASVVAGAVGESTQTYTRNVTSNVPASTFGASTGGDGWDVFFYDNYVLNIFHHDGGAIKLDCHLRSAAGGLSGGARCSGFNPTDASRSMFTGYVTGDRSGGWVNGSTGKLYAFTAPSAGTKSPGVFCINLDVAPPTACGFVALSSDTNINNYSGLSNAEGIGGRLFGIETFNNKLLCYDPTTNAKCVGSPIALAGTTGQTSYFHVYGLGSKVFASTDTTLYCFEASTLEKCGNSWPVTYASLGWTARAMPPVAHMDASGQIDGVCLSPGCLDFTGASKNGTWVNPHSITSWGVGGTQDSAGRYGKYEATAGRAFLGRVLSSAQVYCFDYATQAACSGWDDTPFASGKGGSLYALRADPTNPNCVFWNSDPGNIGLFSALTGETSCAGSPVITMQPSQFAPRFVCTTPGGIDRWSSITLTAVTGGTATSRLLTVRKANGDAIAGWTDVPLSVGVVKDLSSLDVAVSGSRPTFNVTFSGVTGSIASADFSIIYDGRGPELCIETVLSSTAVSGSPACPTITGIAGNLTQNVSSSTTENAAGRSFTISGNAGQCAENISYAGPPGKPLSVTCLKSTSNVALTFATPSDDGGSAVRWYELSVDGGTNWTVLSSTLSSGTYSATVAMSTASVSTCRVRAVNVLGNGTAEAVTATTINVIYDGNGHGSGSVPIDSTNYPTGGTVTVVGNTGVLTKAGYTFDGWCTTQPAAGAPCGGVARVASNTFAIMSNTTLYAVWSADTLTVTYDSQGGSAIASGSTTTGASIAVSPGTPTRAGYGFAGWFVATSGGSAISFPHAHGETANFTRHAQWTPNTLTVTYDSQGGSAIASGSTTTGASIAVSPGTPTRAGYGFTGWFTAATGGSALTFPHAHGRTTNFTLYAQWAGNPHTITYDGNGSTGGAVPSAASGTFGSSFTVATNSGLLVREGFAFAGWNTRADDSGDDYVAGVGSFVVAGDVTLYAVWTDATAPATPGTPDLVAASDSGASSTDDLTKFTTLTISVKAGEAGGTVTVRAERDVSTVATVAVMATTSAKSCTMAGSTSGSTCDVGVLTEGSWRVTSVQADATNNVSEESVALIVRVDPTAPIATLSTPTETSTSIEISFTVTGNEALDCATLSKTPGVDFDLAEITELGDIAQATGTNCVIPATSTAKSGGGTVISALTSAQFFAVSDLAGNSQVALRESPQSVRVTIDAPQTPTNTVRKSAPVTVSESSAVISFKPSTASASVKSYAYSVDGGKTWRTAKISSMADGKVAIEVEGLEVGKAYTIEIRAVTLTGETKPEITRSFKTKSPLPVSGSDASSALLLALLFLSSGLVLLVGRSRAKCALFINARPTKKR